MSIDMTYQAVLATLKRKGKIEIVSTELLRISTNDERVLYVYYLLRDMNVFPRYIIEIPKKECSSIHYRNLGNECFQKSQDYMAWQYYNLSLLNAPPLSDHYVLALANRSAVFFSMKKFEECLIDIQKVLSMKHPEKIREKLYKRQSACKEALAEQDSQNGLDIMSEIEKILVLRGPKDVKYVCASSKLKVVCNEQMGRHVVAREDIKVGEVLVQEDPYFALLLKDQYLFSCNYCLSRSLNLLPCDLCIYVLYCSDKCKERAWQEYHKTECLLLPMLFDMQFSKLELLALRTVIKARTDHEDWPSLIKTISKAETYKDSQNRGCVKIGQKWVFDSKHYTSIHTLASNVEKRTISDLFQKCVTAAVFFKLLTDGTDFINCVDDVKREKVKRCVAGTLLLHIMTSPTNMHGLSSNIATEDGKYVSEISIASAPYAFHSLLNHSCAPNVVRFSKLGSSQMTLFALRPIKKGMQLFDNYGYHHALEHREKRQETLKSQYKFTCICEACVNDWPVYCALRPVLTIPYPIKVRKEKLLSIETIQKLENGDKSKALELFQPLCDMIEEFEPYAPCMELADCQESLKQCLAIFGGLVPHGYSKVVDWKAIPPA